MPSEHKKWTPIISLAVSLLGVLAGGAYNYWHSSPSVLQTAIRVVDSSTKQPIAHAYVNAEVGGGPRVSGVTDENGLYVVNIAVPRGTRQFSNVIVGADGYLVGKGQVSRSSTSTVEEISLERLPLSTQGAVQQRSTTTMEALSGEGANWGPYYRVCSNPAPAGYRVAKTDFYLVGDRQCGAWAECKPTQQSDSLACWDFRLQGHGERSGDGHGRGLGVLNVTYEKLEETPEQLGEKYWMGRGVPLDYNESLRWFRQGAEQGDARAMANIGWMYENGLGISRDYSQALNWYQKAAANGDVIANWNIARVYQNGYGVPADLDKARQWYSKGAALGDSRAAKALLELGGASESSVSTQKVCRLYGEAAQGASAWNRDDACSIPNAEHLDTSFQQGIFICCGGGATSPTTNANIPPGIELQVTGGHYWSVANPRLLGNQFFLHTYCGPEPAPGPGCNVSVDVIAHYR